MSGRGGARRRAVLIAIGAIVLAGGAATASAAPDRAAPLARIEAAAKQADRAARAADESSDQQSTGPAAELPSRDTALITGTDRLATSLRDARAKVSIRIPTVTTAVYALPNSRKPASGLTTFRAPAGLLPARPNPACDYYVSEVPADLYVIDLDQPDKTKPGVIRSIGVFPEAKVGMLAFGGLPVTATLHTTQVRRNGKIVPLTVDGIESGKTVLKTDPAGADGAGGCDAGWEANLPKPTISQGEVTGRFSDVRVDGHPVDVGDSCQSATPLRLNLVGETEAFGGQYKDVISGGVLVQQLNRATVNPANPIRTFPGSSNLTIPPFVGCKGKNGEDVSKLITGMVSGQATLAVNQAAAIINNFDPSSPSGCFAFDPPDCGVPPQHVFPPNPGR